MAVATVDRVAARAASVPFARVLLTLLMVPFYVLGFLAGVAWAGISWAYAAMVEGFVDGRARAKARSAPKAD